MRRPVTQPLDFCCHLNTQVTFRTPIGAQGNHPRQAHNARPASLETRINAGKVQQPGPHDSSALLVAQTLRSKENIVGPTHLPVSLRIELLVFPLANIVAAAHPMADTEQYVLIPQPEQFRTGDIFIEGDPVDAMSKQVANVAPLTVHGGGFGNGRMLTTENRVVMPVFIPRKGIPRSIALLTRSMARRRRRDRICRQLLPVIEIVIERNCERITLPHLVIANGRHPVFIEKAVATVHTLNQSRGVVTPVAQIGTGHMPPMIGFLAEALVLKDVKKVVTALPKNGAVGIERHGDALGCNKVIPRSPAII